MKEEVNILNCGRENDLIAFLYGELGDAESRTFQHHMRDCPACGVELTALRDVRDSVVAWRNESLGGVISTETINKSYVTKLSAEKASALAALREFFSLSPPWMKGAVALATLVFCVLAGLAVARWRDIPSPAVATNPNAQVYSEQQLNALVEQRVRDELQRIKSSKEPAPTSPLVVDISSQRNPGRRVKPRAELANNVAGTVRQQRARRPLSRVEREQLAADLRLTDGSSDGELDLLDDKINQ